MGSVGRKPERERAKGRRKVKQEAKRTILIAGMGTSPAVLTETVWALAHQKKSVVPDEIVVITTTSGKNGVVKALLSGTPCVWEQLKDALRKEKIKVDDKLKFSEKRVKVMLDSEDRPMDDLRIGQDNLDAADFMLHELRAYTDESDTTVLCSIAGGRKTMSALLFSCMTLVGREQDKVYHVLIPPEYECGMEPPFYFPQKGVSHLLLSRGKPTDKKVSSLKIGIELFEVPYVRMRGLYQDKFKVGMPRYRALVSTVQKNAPPAVVYPEIEIDAWNGGVVVNGVSVKMSASCFALLILLANGCVASELFNRLLKIHAGCLGSRCQWLSDFAHSPLFNSEDAIDDFTKTMSNLRKKFKGAGFDQVESLVPRRGAPVMFPLARIKWRNRERLADICGYLFPAAVK